jgi:hypothetical protein
MEYIEIVSTYADNMSDVRLLPKAIINYEKTGDTTLKNKDLLNESKNIYFYGNVENSQINTNSNNNIQYNINNDTSILDKLVEIIKSTNEIELSSKKDLFADIEIIRNEITKSKPDKSLIEKKIDMFGKFTPLIPYIPAILEWLNKL